MEYLSHDELVKNLSEEEINAIIRQGTAVRPNDVIQKVITQLEPKPKVIVEIGTWRGLSSLVMASCKNVEKVYTFDIRQQDNDWLWNRFDLRDKIVYKCLPNSFEIYKEMQKIDFDFAYIDGSHTTEEETRDFLITKMFCDRILMDDTDDNRVFGIFLPYGAQRVSFRFAYWGKDGNYDIVNKIKPTLKWDEPYGKLDFRHLDGA